MSKVLITGDIHIHNHRNDMRRVDDGLKCLRWIYDTARANECKHLIIAGDFLHNRFQLPLYAYSKACRIVAENKDVPTIFLLGNHDMFYEDKWDVHSLTPLQEWATVIDEPKTLYLCDDYPVDFLPYTPKPSAYLPTFGKGNVLVSHLAIAQALLNLKYNVLSVEDDSKEKEVIKTEAFKRWKKTWLGHYHYGQQLSHNVEYIGSPMQLTYGEAGQEKHVAVFDLKTLETKYVINDQSPKFHIVSGYDELPKQVDNDYIRFRSDETIADKFEIRKGLAKLGAREIEFDRPSIDVVEKTNAALTNIASLFADKKKLIHTYIDNVEITGLNRDLLKKLAMELIS